MQIRYRVRQFCKSIYPQKLTSGEALTVQKFLKSSEWDLFKKFSVSDQKHSFNVFQRLLRNGSDDPDLLTAALLHDIGKTKVQMSVWDRSIAVIIEKIFPERADRWGLEGGEGWKHPFVIRSMHPQWGAELAEEAGSKVMVINLIRRHQDPLFVQTECLEDKYLALLQWADNQE